MKLGEEDASLVFLGGQLGIVILEQAVLAAHGGQMSYNLLKRSDNAVPGRWSGNGYGVSLGSQQKVDAKRMSHVTFDYLTGSLKSLKANASQGKTRKLDQIRLSLTYTFHGFF